MIKNLGLENSVLNQFIAEIRDKEIQTDSMRFRKNLERIGEIFAYEISKTFNYKEQEVRTPLGLSNISLPVDKILISTILRAGLPLHQGILNFFDRADNAFISAYRKYSKDGSFTIKFEYLSSPSLDKKILILNDPMLATGSSMLLAHQAMLRKGTPGHTHIVSIIASKEGLVFLRKHMDMENVTVWVGAIDDELTVKSYIVPGLGDAGDLAYGDKL